MRLWACKHSGIVELRSANKPPRVLTSEVIRKTTSNEYPLAYVQAYERVFGVPFPYNKERTLKIKQECVEGGRLLVIVKARKFQKVLRSSHIRYNHKTYVQELPGDKAAIILKECGYRGKTKASQTAQGPINKGEVGTTKGAPPPPTIETAADRVIE